MQIEGFEELNKIFSDLQDVPESIMNDTLMAMAKVGAEKIKQHGESMGVRDAESSVHILDKIKVQKFKKTETGGYVDISFSGTRTRDGKKTNNTAIAFLGEYGTREQPARPFVREAIEEDGEEIAAPGIDIFGDWMEKTFQD